MPNPRSPSNLFLIRHRHPPLLSPSVSSAHSFGGGGEELLLELDDASVCVTEAPADPEKNEAHRKEMT